MNMTCIVQYRIGAQSIVGIIAVNTEIIMFKKWEPAFFIQDTMVYTLGSKHSSCWVIIVPWVLSNELTGRTGPWANGIRALKFCSQKLYWLPWKKDLTDSKEATHVEGETIPMANKVVNKVTLQKQKGSKVIGNT